MYVLYQVMGIMENHGYLKRGSRVTAMNVWKYYVEVQEAYLQKFKWMGCSYSVFRTILSVLLLSMNWANWANLGVVWSGERRSFSGDIGDIRDIKDIKDFRDWTAKIS